MDLPLSVLSQVTTILGQQNIAYLHTWASKLGVEDLLQRALDDVKEESDL